MLLSANAHPSSAAATVRTTKDSWSQPQNQACCALRCAAPAVQVPEGFFDYCKENSIPVLGICYGMQVGCGATASSRLLLFCCVWPNTVAAAVDRASAGWQLDQMAAFANLRLLVLYLCLQLIVHQLGGEVKTAEVGGEYGRMPMNGACVMQRGRGCC